jgi:hypothetical protein
MKRILAALDDSGIAASVVAEASALARATDAKVMLLRALPEANVAEEGGVNRA